MTINLTFLIVRFCKSSSNPLPSTQMQGQSYSIGSPQVANLLKFTNLKLISNSHSLFMSFCPLEILIEPFFAAVYWIIQLISRNIVYFNTDCFNLICLEIDKKIILKTEHLMYTSFLLSHYLQNRKALSFLIIAL